MPFKRKTGLIGCTEPNQEVTKDNVHELPPGSVIRDSKGGRLIHLHDNLWLWESGSAHCYDRVEYLFKRMVGKVTLCHIP